MSSVNPVIVSWNEWVLAQCQIAPKVTHGIAAKVTHLKRQ